MAHLSISGKFVVLILIALLFAAFVSIRERIAAPSSEYFSMMHGIPLPFEQSIVPSLNASVTDIGQKGDKRIVVIDFDHDDVTETLATDALNIVLTDNDADLSHSAPLSAAIASGKRVYGYKYSSKNAALEKAAANQQGTPLAFADAFPGTFFASEEERNQGTIIADFMNLGVDFLPLSAVTFERNARYVFLTSDQETTLTARNLLWCGDGIITVPEQCDPGGLHLEDGCDEYTCMHNDECSDGIDNDGDGLIDGPHTEATITTHPEPVTVAHLQESILRTSYITPDGETAYLVGRKDNRLFLRETHLTPLSWGRTLHINLYSTDASTQDLFGDGTLVVNPADHIGYLPVRNNDSQQFIARVDLSSMSHDPAVDIAPLLVQDRNITTGVLDTQGRFAYFATFVPGGSYSNRIVKFDLSTFTRVGHLDTFAGASNSAGFLTSFMDPSGSYAYFGDAQGRLTRVHLATFTSPSSEDILQLTRADGAQNPLQLSAVALSGDEAFVVSVPRLIFNADPYAHPSSEIYRIDLDTFSLVQTFILHPVAGRVTELSIDPANGNLFLGASHNFTYSLNRGSIHEFSPNLQLVGGYAMDLIAAPYAIRPVEIRYLEGIRYMFAGFNPNPNHFVRYKIGGTDPECPAR